MSSVKKYTIREASDKFGYSEMYIRRLLLEGKIAGTKVDGQWQIDESSLVTKQAQTTNTREVRAFIVHVKSEDIDKVREMLAKHDVQLEPRFVYDDKRKAYNKSYREAHAKK